ncbi:transcription factor grauzone-like isoform X2 [Armigeres subalbatus]|uniref:transcription factor grauzone-like isoform X2 n=1 Tax=Armigeres subalbatus TaxID=124917 RepID=UPI002ED4C590
MDIGVEFLEINTCAVCLNERPDLLAVQFDETQDRNIGPILVKHLWFQPEQLYYKNVCGQCWDHVNIFNIFYNSVEKAHINLELSAEAAGLVGSCKTEPLTLDSESLETYELEVEDSVNFKKEKNENLLKEADTKQKQENNDKQKHNTPHKEPEAELDDACEDFEHSDYEPNDSKSESESSEENDNLSEQIKKPLRKVRKKQSFQKSPKTSIRSYNKPTEQIEEEDRKIITHCKLQCTECEESSPRFSDFKQHARKVHHIAHPVVICCGRRFNKRIKLLEHVTKHMNPDAFQCTLCEKSYCNSLNLRIHMMRHNPPDKLDHKCDKCERSFAKKYQLNAHQLRHVPEEERTFICTSCKKSFATKYAMQQHYNRVHLKELHFTCDTCAKSFYSKQALQVHQTTHSDDLPSQKVQCADCGSWHKHMVGLMKHRKRHHEQEQKMYPCPDCGKVTRSMTALKSHQNYNHRMESSHGCQICGKAFKRPIDLKEHMASHTGMPLYKCTYCERQFNSSSNMFSHRKREHRIQWEIDQKLNIKVE